MKINLEKVSELLQECLSEELKSLYWVLPLPSSRPGIVGFNLRRLAPNKIALDCAVFFSTKELEILETGQFNRDWLLKQKLQQAVNGIEEAYKNHFVSKDT